MTHYSCSRSSDCWRVGHLLTYPPGPWNDVYIPISAQCSVTAVELYCPNVVKIFVFYTTTPIARAGGVPA